MIHYFDEYSDYDDVREYNPVNKKRATRRRWQDIENFKERRRLSREIIRDDNLYFELLERH
ncbi:MAG: DUF3545 family protein [Psychrosphaera sp.]|nr:DUF3545 family protein [Psychrosphaera sp.]